MQSDELLDMSVRTEEKLFETNGSQRSEGQRSEGRGRFSGGWRVANEAKVADALAEDGEWILVEAPAEPPEMSKDRTASGREHPDVYGSGRRLTACALGLVRRRASARDGETDSC